MNYELDEIEAEETCKHCKTGFTSKQGYELHLIDGECPAKKRKQELEDAGLSQQQAHLWALYEEGYSAKDISQITNNKKNTVESHLQRVRNKKKKAKNLIETLNNTKSVKQ